MSVTVINPAIHLVKDTSAAQFFRRKLRDPDIMTFWSQPTGQWILGYWLHRGKRIVDEMEDLGPNFEGVTDEMVRDLTQCYGSVDLKRVKKRLISRNADRIRKQDDDMRDYNDKWHWLKKRTAAKSPIPYAFTAPLPERGY